MKDFYRNYVNVNPKLDVNNSYIIYNNTVSTTEEIRYYTPEKDGVVIIACSFRQAAKVFVDALKNDGKTIRLGSIVQSANSAGADNGVMMIPVISGELLTIKGRNFSAEYYPYL